MAIKNENSVNSMDVENLMAILPASLDEEIRSEMADLVSRISRKKVPANSFLRVWILGSFQARVTCGYLACWLQTRFADNDERETRRRKMHLSTALKLFGTMGYLRGAVMKVGQMLANLPEIVPEEFAEVLAGLNFEAPPMHFALVREVFLDSFGREPEEMFNYFERKPFAAASLGQVHRARLHSGEDVAVKIQYPDIARTIRADMRTLRVLLQPMRLSSEWPHVPEKLDDLEKMLLMETDYAQEARFGKEIRELFSDDERVVVPRVYESHSSERILTTEFIRGCHIREFLATGPSQQVRDHFTNLLIAATMRLFYRKHWLLGDPNPGNYIFMEDGRLGLIDFGCTRSISADEWVLQGELESAAICRDEERLNHAIARACLYEHPDQMDPERLEIIGRGARWQLEPWMTEGLFDFGDRDFLRRGIDSVVEISRKRYTRGSPLYLWTNRFVLGTRAMAYRLGGRCNFRAIHQEESAF